MTTNYPEGFDEVVPGHPAGFDEVLTETPVGMGEFASGTKARMAEYTGLSPEQATQKYYHEWGQTLGKIKETVSDPAKLAAVAGSAFGAVKDFLMEDPTTAAHKIARYYYQNPDVFATDVAATFAPLSPLGKAVEGGTAAERAAALKTAGGAKIGEAEASGEAIPAETFAPTVEKTKAEAKPYYNPMTHADAKSVFKIMEDVVPEGGGPPPMRANIGGREIPISPEKAAQIRESAAGKLAGLSPEAPTSGKTITLQDMHDLREKTADVSSAQRPQERAVGHIMKNNLDEFFVNNFMEGKKMSEGIKDYARASTALEFKNLVDRAMVRKSQMSQGRFDASIATELRNYSRPTLKGDNPRMRMLKAVSKPAYEMVKKAASGGDALQQVLRGIGSAAPTGVMSFTLDSVAGHLLHNIVPGGAGTIMGIGAGAKWLAGSRGLKGVEDIMNTILEGEPRARKIGLPGRVAGTAALQNLISQPVYDKLQSHPASAQAVKQWESNPNDITTRTLATMIAKTIGTPKLVPRIEKEIGGLTPGNVTNPEPGVTEVRKSGRAGVVG